MERMAKGSVIGFAEKFSVTWCCDCDNYNKKDKDICLSCIESSAVTIYDKISADKSGIQMHVSGFAKKRLPFNVDGLIVLGLKGGVLRRVLI